MDYQARTAEFRARLERQGLDAYWLVKAANVRYLCGFTGEDSTLLVTPSRSVLITDSRYTERAEAEAVVEEVFSRNTAMARAAASLADALGVRLLGVTSGNLSHADYAALSEALEQATVLARKTGPAEQMRRRKDPHEVAAIRESLALAEACFRRLTAELEPGRTEKWLASRLQHYMQVEGAEDASFEIICAADARSSVPHATAGRDELAPDGVVLFDWGARREGYCSDLTRVVPVATIPPILKELAEVVLEAQEAVFASLKPGNTCGEADRAGRAVIAGAGYGRRFGHGIGHGVGLEVHEDPRLGPTEETVLLPGMVLTVEPGIYLPGRLGVRIEEMALLTPDGHEVLTTLPRRPEDLLQAGL